MRISKVEDHKDQTVTIEIDTEASPYNPPMGTVTHDSGDVEVMIATPRVPTPEEYAIIRALLDLPEPGEAPKPDPTIDFFPSSVHAPFLENRPNLNGMSPQDHERVLFDVDPPVTSYRCGREGCPGLPQLHADYIHDDPKEAPPE